MSTMLLKKSHKKSIELDVSQVVYIEAFITNLIGWDWECEFYLKQKCDFRGRLMIWNYFNFQNYRMLRSFIGPINEELTNKGEKIQKLYFNDKIAKKYNSNDNEIVKKIVNDNEDNDNNYRKGCTTFQENFIDKVIETKEMFDIEMPDNIDNKIKMANHIYSKTNKLWNECPLININSYGSKVNDKISIYIYCVLKSLNLSTKNCLIELDENSSGLRLLGIQTLDYDTIMKFIYNYSDLTEDTSKYSMWSEILNLWQSEDLKWNLPKRIRNKITREAVKIIFMGSLYGEGIKSIMSKVNGEELGHSIKRNLEILNKENKVNNTVLKLFKKDITTIKSIVLNCVEKYNGIVSSFCQSIFKMYYQNNDELIKHYDNLSLEHLTEIEMRNSTIDSKIYYDKIEKVRIFWEKFINNECEFNLEYENDMIVSRNDFDKIVKKIEDDIEQNYINWAPLALAEKLYGNNEKNYNINLNVVKGKQTRPYRNKITISDLLDGNHTITQGYAFTEEGKTLHSIVKQSSDIGRKKSELFYRKMVETIIDIDKQLSSVLANSNHATESTLSNGAVFWLRKVVNANLHIFDAFYLSPNDAYKFGSEYCRWNVAIVEEFIKDDIKPYERWINSFAHSTTLALKYKNPYIVNLIREDAEYCYKLLISEHRKDGKKFDKENILMKNKFHIYAFRPIVKTIETNKKIIMKNIEKLKFIPGCNKNLISM